MINKVSNKEEFIEKALALHGNIYDYSAVEYILSSYKVKIKCSTHGIFEQTSNAHLGGQGCPKCGRIRASLNRRLTLEEFINRSSIIHKNKYDYSKVIYKGCDIKVEINCPKHGLFQQRPSNHLSGKGCERCAWELPRCNELSTDKFIVKARKLYGDFYDYSLVDYKRSCIKVKIICPKHGVFEQTPNNHLMGMKCIKCANEENAEKRRFTVQEFIEKAIKVHGLKYNYSEVDYAGNAIKIKIICPEHGVFLQVPYSHLMGKGCPGCGRWSLLNTKIFIERSIEKHGKKFDYSQVEYINARTKVKIICPKHGVFEQTPQSHLSGNGCPTCLESKGEKKISLFLDSNKIKFIREKSFEKCRDKNPLLFDFFLPDFNTCIEFDGKQHYQPIAYFGGEAVFEKTKKSDAIKANFCKKEGISLIRISSYKGHDIESVLKNLLIL